MTSPGGEDPSATPGGSPLPLPVDPSSDPQLIPPTLPPGTPGPRPTTTAPARHLSTAGQVVSGDWPAQAADQIVNLVDNVRDKTTGPIQTAARALIYGILAGILGVVVVVLLIIWFIRLLDILVDKYLPWGDIWLPYAILGVILLAAGTFFFRRRRLVPS